jgi:hypothetical protein
MQEYVNLFHGTDYEYLDQIEGEGIRSNASRGIVNESQEGIVSYETVYLYDPEELSDYIKEGFEDVFVEVRVPKDNIYVTKYGSGAVQNMNIEDLEENAFSYQDYEEGEIPYMDSSPLMFLSTEDIPVEDMLALKWSL